MAKKDTPKELAMAAATVAGLDPEKVTVFKSSDSAMGEFLGLSKQAFYDLRKRDGDQFPKKTSRGWRTADVVNYLLETGRLERQAGDGADGGPVSYHVARARKTLADAEKQEMAVRQLKKELILASDVEREWSTQISKLNTTVEKSFHSLAPKLSGLDAPAILAELQEWWRKNREKMAE